MHLLAAKLSQDPSPHFEDLFSRCLLCGACEDVCPRNLPITDLTKGARGGFSRFYGRHGFIKYLTRKTLAHPGLLDRLGKTGVRLKKLDILPADSGMRLRLGLLEDADGAKYSQPQQEIRKKFGEEQKLWYFSGCLARHLQPSIAEASNRLAKQFDGQETVHPKNQRCCGLAALSAGKKNEAVQLAQKNISAFPGDGPILTSCASCFSHLQSYPELFSDDSPWKERAVAFSNRLCEFGDFFAAKLSELNVAVEPGEPSHLVHYHEPCHLRFPKRQNGPRRLLDSMDNIELVDAKPHCCGQGGLFHLGYPEISAEIFQKCAAKPLSEGADIVTTTCSGCLMQWQQQMFDRQERPQILHLSLLLQKILHS